MDIKITFNRPDDPAQQVTLSWTLLQNQAVLLWFNLFVLNLENTNRKLFARFSGFVNDKKNIPTIIDELNRCIECLDSHGIYRIKERCRNPYTQEDLNAIHHHFEILSTSEWSEFVATAPENIRSAIRGINYFIHDLEVHTRNLNMKKSNPKDGAVAILFEFRGGERFVLPENFNSYFQLERDFGDMVLHYAQVGKTWIEAFWDRDEIIFNEAIRPLEILSGEMDIIFARFKLINKEKEEFEDFLKSHQKVFDDPQLRLGHLKVATFNNDLALEPWQYEEIIAAHCDITSIEVVDNGKIICRRNFEDSTKVF